MLPPGGGGGDSFGAYSHSPALGLQQLQQLDQNLLSSYPLGPTPIGHQTQTSLLSVPQSLMQQTPSYAPSSYSAMPQPAYDNYSTPAYTMGLSSNQQARSSYGALPLRRPPSSPARDAPSGIPRKQKKRIK
eukprot:3437702-Pyramimonas_sp.AAC.2